MDANKAQLRLKVQEGYTADVGRGIARVDGNLAKELNLSKGDVIEIEGRRKTFAKCELLYPADQEREIVRFDGLIRNNAGIAIGEYVEVRGANALPAQKVTVTPLEPAPPIDERYLTDVLENVPLTKGDNVMIPFFGGRLVLQVVSTSPEAEVVLVKKLTVFDIVQTLKFPSYFEVGGLSAAISQLKQRIEVPLLHPEVLYKLGVELPRSVLLCGQTGVGKTLLMKATTNELCFSLKNLKVTWAAGLKTASQVAAFRESEPPALLLLDNLDIILPGANSETLSEIVSALDSLERGKFIIAAARNANEINSGLRRRFHEIRIGQLDAKGRLEVLKIYSSKMPMEGVDMERIASRTEGLVGSDIERLCADAGNMALERWIQTLPPYVSRMTITPEDLDKLVVTNDDFLQSLRALRSELGPTGKTEPS